MKRTELVRKTPLRQKVPLRSRPSERSSGLLRPSKPLAGSSSHRKQKRPQEPGETEWKRERTGICASCKRRGKIRLHHVVRERDIRQLASPEEIADGICWRLENAIGLGAPYVMGGNVACQCHANHHSRGISDRRLPISLIPPAARTFVVELMGPERAWDYLDRHYRQDNTKEQA